MIPSEAANRVAEEPPVSRFRRFDDATVKDNRKRLPECEPFIVNMSVAVSPVNFKVANLNRLADRRDSLSVIHC
mgnify:CR=1 FL=1